MGPWLDIYEGTVQYFTPEGRERFEDTHQFHCENPEDCGTTFSYKSDEIPDDSKEINPEPLPKEQPG